MAAFCVSVYPEALAEKLHLFKLLAASGVMCYPRDVSTCPRDRASWWSSGWNHYTRSSIDVNITCGGKLR